MGDLAIAESRSFKWPPFESDLVLRFFNNIFLCLKFERKTDFSILDLSLFSLAPKLDCKRKKTFADGMDKELDLAILMLTISSHLP